MQSVTLPSIHDMFPDFLLYNQDLPPPPYTSSGTRVQQAKPRAQPKKHYCPLCRRAFNRPSNLAIHMNIHTGVTPYVCTFPSCGRAFNVKANMHRHYRNTHDDQESTDQRTSSRSPGSPQEPSRSTGRPFALVTPVQWGGDSRSSSPTQDSVNT